MRATFIVAALTVAATLCPTPSRSQTLNDLLGVQIVGNVNFRQQVAAARSIGIRNVRLGVRASDVVDRSGKYNWNVVDGRLSTVLGSEMRPIVTIFGIPSSEQAPNSQTHSADEYAEFASQVVRHFGTTASRKPIIYELWNEPNTKTFWGSPPDPEAYSAMALKACEAIKAADPGASVVGLAMEGTPVKAPYFVAAYHIDIYREWAARAYTPELARCLDGVSMHPYRASPETYITDEPSLTTFLRRSWRKSIAPLVVNSEWGYAVDHKKNVSQVEQANLDIRAALIGASFGRITNLYTSLDPVAPSTQTDDGYGLVGSGGVDKVSARALRLLMRTLGECVARDAREVVHHAGVFRVDFTCSLAGSQSHAIAMWSADGESSVGADELKLPLSYNVIELSQGDTAPVKVRQIQATTMPRLIIYQ